MSYLERGNSVTTFELSLMEAVFAVWSMLIFLVSVFPLTIKLEETVAFPVTVNSFPTSTLPVVTIPVVALYSNRGQS